MKDINLPKSDKYGTSMLISFLHQLCTFKGFYNNELEFISLENIQIVASMNPSTTVGRNCLSTRFTAIVKILYMDYPSSDELLSIFTSYINGLESLGIRNDNDSFNNIGQTLLSYYVDVK